jgi:hypothetical protein
MTRPGHHSQTRSFLVIIAVALSSMLLMLLCRPAQATFDLMIEQVGTSVVVTGSGSLDLTGLSFIGSSALAGEMDPSFGLIFTGSPNLFSVDLYRGFTGPNAFGDGTRTTANSGNGQIVGINNFLSELAVPQGYLSGTPLVGTSIYDNQTLGSLGVTPGMYLWTWGSIAADDSFTLDIVAVAAPAPSIGRGLPVLLAVGGILFGSKLLERGKH